MNQLIVYTLLVLGIVAALVGGVFQSFSDFIMKGLALAEPAGGMESMQQINRTVFRSAFLFSFLALVPIVVGLAIYASFALEGPPRNLLISAAVVYVLSVFLVTIAGNVPMNEKLDKMPYASEASHAYWAVYCTVWTRWNHVRTVGSIATAALLLAAALSGASQSNGS